MLTHIDVYGSFIVRNQQALDKVFNSKLWSSQLTVSSEEKKILQNLSTYKHCDSYSFLFDHIQALPVFYFAFS